MRVKIIYIGILLFLLSSCKKPEESELWTEVNVAAVNFNTGEPLNDIYISIVQTKNKTLFDSDSEVISEGWTDENGNYYFGWKAKKSSKYSYEYIAQANAGKYYQVSFPQFDFVSIGAVNSYNIELIPYGTLNFSIQNQNCFNVTDTMWFKTDHTLITYQSEDWNPLPRTGCYSLLDSEGYLFPIGDYEFTMKIKRDGITSYQTKNITLLEGETKLVELFY